MRGSYDTQISVSRIRDILQNKFEEAYAVDRKLNFGFICWVIESVCAMNLVQWVNENDVVNQLGILYCGSPKYFSNSDIGIEESLSDSELLQFYRKGLEYLSSWGFDFSGDEYKYEQFRYRGDPDAEIQVKFGRGISRIGLLTKILERNPDAKLVIEVTEGW